MRFLTKTFTWVLVFSLLAQTALAAPQTQERPSLQDIQTQAREDKNWLERNSVAVLGGVSALSIYAVARLAVKNAKNKQLAEELTEKLNVATRQARDAAQGLADANHHIQELDRSLEYANKQASALFTSQQELAAENAFLKSDDFTKTMLDQNRHLTNKVNGLQKGREIQLAKYQTSEQLRAAAELKAMAVESELSGQIKVLEEQLAMTERFLNQTIALNPQMQKAIDQYAEMFNATRSTQERATLRAALEDEKWFKAFTKEEQAGVLRVVDEAMGNMPYISRQGSLIVFSNRLSGVVAESTPEASRFIMGLGKKLLTSKNLLSAGIILGLIAMNAAPAKAQSSKMAARIENNFDLFLNATPEQLAEMEKYDDVYEACVRGAAVRHELTTLDGEERAQFNTAIKQAPRTSLKTKNLAY